MEEETTEQLRARLAATNQRIEDEKARTAQQRTAVEEAKERWRLRREIARRENALAGDQVPKCVTRAVTRPRWASGRGGMEPSKTAH